MKFKIVVTSLLTAILAVCLFTSYTLINEAKRQTEEAIKQTQLQLSQAEGILAIAEYASWYEQLNIKNKTDFISAGDVYLQGATDIWHEIRYPELHIEDNTNSD